MSFASVDHKPVNPFEKFCKLEDCGAVNSGEKPLSIEDKKVMQIIDSTALVD